MPLRIARPTLCHVLSGWRVGRQEARIRHSQTVNMDLSLPDRGGELGLTSTHKARGPDPEARNRRRRLVVEPEAAGEAQTNAGGVNVKITFSSAARARSVVERSHTSNHQCDHSGRPDTAPRPVPITRAAATVTGAEKSIVGFWQRSDGGQMSSVYRCLQHHRAREDALNNNSFRLTKAKLA